MGIEPTPSAWKAEVLPLNYTRKGPMPRIVDQTEKSRDRAITIACRGSDFGAFWWRGEDSNLRRLSRQIYSLIPLTTREPLQKCKPAIVLQTWLGVNSRVYKCGTSAAGKTSAATGLPIPGKQL